MKDRTNRIVLTLLIVSVIFGGIAWRTAPSAAAPSLIPTPLTIPQGAATGITYVTFKATGAITADAGGPALNLPSYSRLDVQYVIDQTIVGTAANTTTLTLQYSNDGANWVNGAALATANVADGTDMNEYPNVGRYTRVYQDVSNTNPITITVLAVAKP